MSVEVSRHDLDRRVVRTKKAIKAALLNTMEEKDISCITISEITRKAGINRRTFYTHYHNISDIIEEIEREMVSVLSQVLSKFDIRSIRHSSFEMFIELDKLVSDELDYYFRCARMDMRGVFMTRLKDIASELADKLFSSNFSLLPETSAIVSEFIVGGFFNVFVEWRINGGNVSAKSGKTYGNNG